MAMVTPILEMLDQTNRIKYPEIDLSQMNLLAVEPSAPPSPPADDVIHVAVGKEVKESELTLHWALHNSAGRRICITHIHQPPKRIPFMGTKFSINELSEHQVRPYIESERQKMQKTLDKYMSICNRAGVFAEKLVLEKDSIENGILELISQHDIRKLVMGGAANKSYSKKMVEPKSKKAIHVRFNAPIFCHIWFICKGHLIHTRESRIDIVNIEITNPPLAQSSSTTTAQSSPVRSSSATTEGQIDPSEYNFGTKSTNFGKYHTQNEISSRFSSCSSSEMIDESQSNVIEGNDLYDKLQQFVHEAENSKREAYEESVKRRKAEKEAIDAIHRAKASEAKYAEELRKKRETEEALLKGKEEVERLKQKLNEINEDLRVSLDEKTLLENQIEYSDKMVNELEQKIFSAVDLLQKYRKERDDLQIERDNALREAEVLKRQQISELSRVTNPQFFSEFSFFEIKEATNNFDSKLKIGEGGYGIIYKGLIRQTHVAIKMLHPNSLQGPLEFQQEVDILSKLRHPNLVTLIGTCPEAWTLVYEYLPNGSLEDRLNCKDNTTPLTWQNRIRIATEICTVLIFLHSCRPKGIIHADLKPSNILLDLNYVSKLSDFGICRILNQDEYSSNNTILSSRNDPQGTFAYMDPEFLETGELNAKSDVYSFGIILLRLLTGRSALGIVKEVQYALRNDNLKDLLDVSGGDWPFIQAKQLTHLALNCCEIKSGSRPDLSSDIWRVLEPMRVSCGVSSVSVLTSEERFQVPSYFICPVFQEIMQDPVVASDGFTYEAEALKGWLDSGHDTSPMTNLKLAHKNLVPNHALRSAIQEWVHP